MKEFFFPKTLYLEDIQLCNPGKVTWLNFGEFYDVKLNEFFLKNVKWDLGTLKSFDFKMI